MASGKKLQNSPSNKMAKGYEQEFLTAYDKYADALFRHCYFRVFNRALAQDLVQETFTRAWKRLADVGPVDNLRAFLYRIMTNLIIDNARKKHEASLDELQEEGFSPANTDHLHIQIKADAKSLFEVLDGLEESYRTVLVLRYIDDLTPKEIAAVLEENTNTVSVRIHRALLKARLLLEQTPK